MNIAIAVLLDEACRGIINAQRELRPISEVHIAPSEYDLVMRAKSAELGRGNNLVLLGLDLVSDAQIRPGTAAIA